MEISLKKRYGINLWKLYDCHTPVGFIEWQIAELARVHVIGWMECNEI